jgi:hypothetical protein
VSILGEIASPSAMFSGEGRRGLAIEGGMGPLLVVVMAPGVDGLASIGQADEPVFIEAFWMGLPGSMK